MSTPVSITASYAFFPLTEAEISALHAELLAFGAAHQMKGLTLIAPEGINATVSGSTEAIIAWKERLRALAPTIEFKDSQAERAIFKKWSVKIKPEIVALRKPDIRPSGKHRHLSPAEWNAMLEQEDVVVLDARNDYEVAIGTFRGAINPKIDSFHEFPNFVRTAALPKDKKVLMYCTGGIRCEKALIAMEEHGYTDVYQLDGGILAYLEQCPNQHFDGECFVFDERVAVDQDLQPSRTFRLCTECGDPARVSEGDASPRCTACHSAMLVSTPSK